jgi:branched-chain amino acid transport system substrate-binding protein
MRRRAFLVLSSSGALAACTGVTYPPPPSYILPAPQTSGVLPGASPPARPIGILLPLSGARAEIAQPMLRAAQLALSDPGSPSLIPADTLGTPSGADAALHRVLGRGVGLILGPLTAAETEVIAGTASAGGIPVLAFTNTASAARPGIWTLGITPAQQVSRLVDYARAQGRTRLAALLPDNEFGAALARALTDAAAEHGLAPPTVRLHAPGSDAVAAALHDLTGGATPPPFDVLLLGDTGEALITVAGALSSANVAAPAVQIVGPALWAAPASRSSAVPGAWYAAPDPAAHAAFAQAFAARYGAGPPGPADLAYDAASIGRVVAPANYVADALTNPAGFAGVDGWLRLLPDGRVQRGLAVFQIGASGAHIISPAPSNARAYAS